MNLITKYFFNTDEMSEKDYSYARIGFIADSALVNAAACFLTGSYLTGLLSLLGATEAQSNFILSLSMPAGFFQLLTPFIARKLTYKKGFVYFSRLFEVFLPATAFLLPLIFSSAGTGIIWLIGLLFFTKHIFGWTAAPIYNDMLMNCLSKNGGLGKFSGIRSSVSNTISCIGTFSAGLIIKHFSGDVQIYGYMWMAIVALSFMAIDAISLFFIKEPYIEQQIVPNSVNLIKIFSKMFKTPKIKTYLKYHIIYTIGTTIAASITNILCIQRLGLSLEIISYLSVASLMIRIVLAPIFGRMSDKKGAKKMIAAGTILVAMEYIIHGMMTSSNVLVLKIITTIISCISAAAITSPSFAFMFESLPEKNRSSYMSCSSVITLIISYIASLLSTAFISISSGLNTNIFGFVLHELNILLFMGAAVVIFSAIVLVRNIKTAE